MIWGSMKSNEIINEQNKSSILYTLSFNFIITVKRECWAAIASSQSHRYIFDIIDGGEMVRWCHHSSASTKTVYSEEISKNSLCECYKRVDRQAGSSWLLVDIKTWQREREVSCPLPLQYAECEYKRNNSLLSQFRKKFIDRSLERYISWDIWEMQRQ